jgi:hypothetical protein
MGLPGAKTWQTARLRIGEREEGFFGPSAQLYQSALSLTHAGDSQSRNFLIQRRKLKEVCDGVGDWVAGRL